MWFLRLMFKPPNHQLGTRTLILSSTSFSSHFLLSSVALFPSSKPSLPPSASGWMNNSPLSCCCCCCVHVWITCTYCMDTYAVCVREWLVQITERSKTLAALHFLCRRTLGPLVTDQFTWPALQPWPQGITHTIWPQNSLRRNSRLSRPLFSL